MTYHQHTYKAHITEPAERYEFDIHTHTIASGHGSSATSPTWLKLQKHAI